MCCLSATSVLPTPSSQPHSRITEEGPFPRRRFSSPKAFRRIGPQAPHALASHARVSTEARFKLGAKGLPVALSSDGDDDGQLQRF